MNNDKRTVLIIVAVLAIMIVGVLAYALLKDDNKKMTDAIKFKEEYTKLNGTVNDKNSKTYPTVELEDLNPFVYKSEEDILKILKNGNGIIYFGYPTCPWCRSCVGILEKAAVNTGIAEISYLNIQEIRSTLELDDADHVLVKKEGSETYKKLLEELDSVLEPFFLTNSDGEKVDTKEKRLYAPTVVTVKEGKVIDIHVGTTESHSDGYREMTKEEQEDLFKIYIDMFKKYTDSSCDEAC